jgi:hypothetical protein
MTDPQLHALVDMFTVQLRQANFTPSEIREAAMLACIKFEMESVRYLYVIPKPAEDAIEELRRFVQYEEKWGKK